MCNHLGDLGCLQTLATPAVALQQKAAGLVFAREFNIVQEGKIVYCGQREQNSMTIQTCLDKFGDYCVIASQAISVSSC